MRAQPIVALLSGLLVVVAGVAWWQTRTEVPSLPPGDEPEVHAPSGAAAADLDQPATTSGTDRAAAAPAAAAPVAPSVPRQPADLADHVTAWLLIVDAATKAPVPAAAAYRFGTANEAAVAYADADGIVPLPLLKPGQMIIARAGYLLRLAPVQAGSTAQLPQIVPLEPDRYCHRCAFHFRLPDGTVPAELQVRFRSQRGDEADQPMPAAVRDGGESVQRAWREQRTLAAVRAVPEVHVQLGHANAAFVHPLAGDDEVAFVEDGLFEIEAITVDGFAARTLFDVAEVQRRPMTVRLRPAGAIRGHVRGTGEQPVADALVVITGGDPLRLAVRTDSGGAFSIGPVANGSYGLEVRHRDHELARVGPFSPDDHDVVVDLKELPKTALRGRVRAAATGLPLAAARATVMDALGQPITAATDADGYFALASSGTDALRLNIAADGYLPHAELVEPGAAAIDVELWPRNADARRQIGLTAILRGIVVDAQGRGVPGMGVRFEAAQPAADWLPGRRVLSGGRMSLPRMATSGSDGSFQLETPLAGPGKVALVAAGASDAGLQVEAVLGQAIDNLRLTARRPQ